MKLGIVGSEEQKFTEVTERAARRAIQTMIRVWRPDLVISGRSPLRGIDWWAIQEAEGMGVATREYEPVRSAWAVPGGFRDRNLKIAKESDVVACVTLKELPPTYQGMRFPGGCYHCHTPPEDHVKSGGCWTMWQARAMHKHSVLIIVWPDGNLTSRMAVSESPRSAVLGLSD